MAALATGPARPAATGPIHGLAAQGMRGGRGRCAALENTVGNTVGGAVGGAENGAAPSRRYGCGRAAFTALAARGTAPQALAECASDIAALTRRQDALQGQQQQAQATLARQREEAAQAESAWQAALAASPFADESAFLQALLPASERQRLAALRQQLQAAQQRAATLLEAAQREHADLQAQALTDLAPEAIQALLQTLQERHTALSEQLGGTRAQLDRKSTRLNSSH